MHYSDHWRDRKEFFEKSKSWNVEVWKHKMSQMTNGDFNQFYQRVFRQIQRIPSVQQSAQVGYIALALSYKPPLFSGEDDLMPLEKWQDKMTYIFSRIGCSEDRKVEVAVRFLVGPALRWWISVERVAMNDKTGWSWDKFMEEMRSQWLVGFQCFKKSKIIVMEQGESSQGNTVQGFPLRQKRKERLDVKCWYCGEFGHFRHQCEHLKFKRREAKKHENKI